MIDDMFFQFAVGLITGIAMTVALTVDFFSVKFKGFVDKANDL